MSSGLSGGVSSIVEGGEWRGCMNESSTMMHAGLECLVKCLRFDGLNIQNDGFNVNFGSSNPSKFLH